MERYLRQRVLDEIGEQGQKTLSQSRVLVIGAGGLSSPLLLYLAAAGVGHIHIFDGDKIEYHNLQRQILYREEDVGLFKADVAKRILSERNSEIDVHVTAKFFSYEDVGKIQCFDVIVDGSDNFGTRYLLHDASALYKTPLVSASIFGFEGQLSVFNYHNGPGLRCLYPEPPASKERPPCAEAGVLGAAVGTLGTLQALEVIKVLLKKEDVLSGRLLLMDLLKASFNKLVFEKSAASLVELRPKAYYEALNKGHCDGVPAVSSISFKGLQDLCKQASVLLLDVRSAEERERFHIGGVHVPLDMIDKEQPALKDVEHVVCYCESGMRSAKAVSILQGLWEEFSFYSLKNGVRPLRETSGDLSHFHHNA